jgi:hypothetical protein
MNLCPHCGKEYSSKQSLEQHVVRLHQQNTVDNYGCTSSRCEYRAQTLWEVKRHAAKCWEVKMDQELERLQEEHRREMKDLLVQKDWEIAQKEMTFRDLLAQKDMAFRDLLAQKDMEIGKLSVRLEMIQKAEEKAEFQLKRSEERVEEMVDSQLKRSNDMIQKCIDRPTITNNNHHNHISNILVDGKTFQEMTDPERIEEIARQKMRPYWLKGQAGVAEFLYNHVICVEEDKKLIACTDASRKKMKYTNEKNEVEDDLGATKFIAKVYQPIRTVSNELHDNITEQIEQDTQTNKIDRFSAELKKEQAMQAAIDIVRIRDSECNQPFTTKLCSLAKV